MSSPFTFTIYMISIIMIKNSENESFWMKVNAWLWGKLWPKEIKTILSKGNLPKKNEKCTRKNN